MALGLTRFSQGLFRHRRRRMCNGVDHAEQVNGLKPRIVRGLKVSRDPLFARKLEDIVGLYMSLSIGPL